MRRSTIAAGTTPLALALLLLTGCAADAPDLVGDPASTLEYAESQGWDDVTAILADGVVTAEENAAAHDAWKACRERFGFSFGPSRLDPVNGKMLFSDEEFAPGTEVDEAAHVLCYSRYSNTVELVYQVTEPGRMNPSLLSYTQRCLDEAGYARPNPGTELGLADFYPEGEASALGDDVHICVQAGHRELFPDVPLVWGGF